MKDVWNFVSWQWKKFEFWQKCWIVSAAFFGAAMVSEPPYVFYLSLVPMIVILGSMLKWVVWDGSQEQWRKYQKEKQELLDTIKNSDKLTTK
jgi:hypothetical protein